MNHTSKPVEQATAPVDATSTDVRQSAAPADETMASAPTAESRIAGARLTPWFWASVGLLVLAIIQIWMAMPTTLAAALTIAAISPMSMVLSLLGCRNE